ncbi:hypothetical protein C4J94_2755 [Pseudomonas sp. R5-89-07]|nr:hypothetical protein C4J94_2755 [Pseudomonas sp. R5-89-07]
MFTPSSTLSANVQRLAPERGASLRAMNQGKERLRSSE